MQSRENNNNERISIDDENLSGLFDEEDNNSIITSPESSSRSGDPSQEEDDFGFLFDESESTVDPSENSSSKEETSSDSEENFSSAVEAINTKDHFMNRNGILSCYNMVPSAFKSLAEMTDYLDQVKEMGFNTVWINPIQEATSIGGKRTDKLNMQRFLFAYSLYAMKSEDMLDQRITTVKRDDQGNYLFTNDQVEYLSNLDKKELKSLFGIDSHEELEKIVDGKDNHVFELKEHYAKKEIELKKQVNELSETAKLAVSKRDAAINQKKAIDEALAGLKSADPDYQTKYENIKKEQSNIALKLREINKECNTVSNDLTDKQTQLNNIDYDLHEAIKKSQTKQLTLVQYFDKKALIAFTDKAKSLGITPIFDLVLNHVGRGSPLITKYPHWFTLDDVFQDVARFNYRKANNEDNIKITDEIIEKFWKPFIKKYIVEYGFEGARIDCVRRLPYYLRTNIYEYISELMQELNKPYPPVLLEELLYGDDKPLDQVIRQMGGDAGGTHITGSVFYKTREWHGGLPSDIQVELGLKSKIVSRGAINFTGNHDHTPLANEIILEMANINRHKDNSRMHQQFNKTIEEINLNRQTYINPYLVKQAKGELKNDITDFLAVVNKTYNSKIRYQQDFEAKIFAHEIKQEIVTNPNGEMARDFLKRVRDKIVLNMFAGSGGFYLLCGDEAANTIPREIYLRENGSEVYPQRIHKLFINPSQQVTDCLQEMSIEMLKDELKISYDKLADHPQEQNRLLYPIINELTNKINAGDSNAQEVFTKKLNKYGIIFGEDDYIPKPRNSENLWAIIDQRFNLQSFIKEQNEILKSLPEPTKGTWAHSFKLTEDLIVTVRVNNFGYTAPAHLILTNLDPDNSLDFGIKELKEIAKYFQQRCYPANGESENEYFAKHSTDVGFAAAWYMILSEQKDKNPIVYCNSGITIDSNLDSMVEIGYQPANARKNQDLFLMPDTDTLADLLQGRMLNTLFKDMNLSDNNSVLTNNNNSQNVKDKYKESDSVKLSSVRQLTISFSRNLRRSFESSCSTIDENNSNKSSISNRK